MHPLSTSFFSPSPQPQDRETRLRVLFIMYAIIQTRANMYVQIHKNYIKSDLYKS